MRSLAFRKRLFNIQKQKGETMKKNSSKTITVIAIILGVVFIATAGFSIFLLMGQRMPKLNPKYNQELEEESEEVISSEVSASFDGFEVKRAGSRKEEVKDTKPKEEQEEEETEEQTEEQGADYLCEYSSERALDEEDLLSITQEHTEDMPEDKTIAQMIINEMYARHGYKFKSEAIQKYFDEKEWYQEIEEYNDDMNEIYKQMSDIEKENIDFLQDSSK